ncbi:MAG: hypothetical protein KBG15_08965 [Kofleriaceae bacterium]|nr:hypothetical protein [Kofleriaceae bacterium]
MGKSTFQVLCLGWAVTLASCGPKVTMVPHPFDEDLTPVATSIEPDTVPVPALGNRAKLRDGRIKRSALLAVLDAGPAVFLHDLDVTALHTAQQFNGWQISQITNPNSPVALADVVRDDVVIAVNHMPLGRPDQLMAAWQALRTAPELLVDLDRNGQQYVLQFVIENDVTPSPAPAAPNAPASGGAPRATINAASKTAPPPRTP